MKKFSASYFNDFRSNVLSHNLKSGEIILEIWEHELTKYDYRDLFDRLLTNEVIAIEKENYKLSEVSKQSALSSIKHGLSTKTNYTVIDKQFSEKEQNQYANGFLQFFKDPILMKTESRLYCEQLDLDDFWEIGGVIVCDDDKIGLFWINDLYDKFN